MAIATMTGSCPGVEQSSIQGGKLPSSSRSINSGAMHLAPAPDIKELSNFLLLERSSIQVCSLLPSPLAHISVFDRCLFPDRKTETDQFPAAASAFILIQFMVLRARPRKRSTKMTHGPF